MNPETPSPLNRSGVDGAREMNTNIDHPTPEALRKLVAEARSMADDLDGNQAGGTADLITRLADVLEYVIGSDEPSLRDVTEAYWGKALVTLEELAELPVDAADRAGCCRQEGMRFAYNLAAKIVRGTLQDSRKDGSSPKNPLLDASERVGAYRAFKLAGPLDVRTGDGMWAVDAVGPPARPVARCLGQKDAERIAVLLSTPQPPGAPEGGWRPIESAPRDGTCFLAFWKAPGADQPDTIIARWNTDSPWVGFHGVNVRSLDGYGTISHLSSGFIGDETLHATHWQPLPEPPHE